eukprot:TRINITY_DN23004_c0_g1_i1.p1 TRINITY_DN23004_c0_g1~~TRINITY_DN23004_c0_g1_i1.p1  ORF type:complete len:611 (-),score=90.60 TRINITY_DN23004_c0_g1_i1:100-1932(-)
MPTTQPAFEPWPLKLEQQQGLRRSRGEVLRIGRILHSIVGFDGRNEGYLCWVADDNHVWDTSRFVFVGIATANTAERESLSGREVPPLPYLPALDHLGRPLGDQQLRRSRALSASGRCRADGNGLEKEKEKVLRTNRSANEIGGTSSKAHSGQHRTSVNEVSRPQLGTQRRGLVSSDCGSGRPSGVCGSSAALDASSAPISTNSTEVFLSEPKQYFSTNSTAAAIQLEQEQVKSCDLCTLVQKTVLIVHDACTVAGWSRWLTQACLYTQGQSNSRCRKTRRASSRVNVSVDEKALRVPLGSHPSSVQPPWRVGGSSTHMLSGKVSREHSSTKKHHHSSSNGDMSPNMEERHRKEPCQDLQITIPIVKPPGWREVQPYVHRMPVMFDERGVKETMIVKMGRWGAFVDRQRAKLQKDIEEAKAKVAGEAAAAADAEAHASTANVAGCGDAGAGAACSASRQLNSEEDVAELQRMIDSMDDWKDLTRYSGKSIGMASTRRGNEMKIHILAFAEREDGEGVDFMRLSYRKSIEVRPVSARRVGGDGASLAQVARSLFPFFSPPARSPEAEEECARLLQCPDVAKFTIALAFREALEDDGIRLNFSEAKFDDGVS